MKNSRLLLVLFVILGLFGSDIYSMKRTQEEKLDSMGEVRDHKKEEKERKARNQDGQRLPVVDGSDDAAMGEVEDQSDDPSVLEVTKLLEFAKALSEDKESIAEFRSECAAAASSGEDIPELAQFQGLQYMSDEALSLNLVSTVKNLFENGFGSGK